MILGIDIGGTNTRLVLYDCEDFRVLDKILSSQKNIEGLSGRINRIVESYGINAIGIGIAGWVKDGRIIKTPNINGTIKFDLTAPYILENDANCFAYGFYKLLADSKIKNIVCITVGTGIGCGIVIDGKIYRGKGLAGELAHIVIEKGRICSCGGRGHLESYFSGWSLEEQFKKPIKEVMRENIEEFYRLREVDIFIKSIANLILVLDPNAIVFGGGIGMNFDKKVVEEMLRDYILPEFDTEVIILKDEDMVAKGAIFLAKETFYWLI
ncbi:MAG: ROK family protein [Candidatus Methanoliparum thermophilum]|uniref:ROK family protein n=1 Tax=Methanoliparum thermophilum TaxID=2491083 RepID=A0A520KT95_METT2|nr:ROK family protein [Candidatus Methanoliparum sp. LAM-1]RZN65213.1 MAG: ROK family protein [Candidatus Methanoliparum thermophilum]BDC36603.1 hypothetical protein MTLP_12850 [Candidatus Methanoliparum sp. LAM-1]